MIELKNNQLVFSFPEVHPLATLNIDLQRTLRIPDDGKNYPLPPGLGSFPLVHVDDHADNVPGKWLEHGGTILPMYQAEALWLNFHPHSVYERDSAYPFAIKISTGKIDAVTGKDHTNGLHTDPQDYMVAPKQPWLDGYCVKKGTIRQFVAMPLGEGYTAEEQITGKAEHGGIQIVVYPMKGDVFEKRFPPVKREARMKHMSYGSEVFAMAPGAAPPQFQDTAMGLAPGGKMKQEIYEDSFGIDDWDKENKSRCFVHLTNSLIWQKITGQKPPHMPPSTTDYNNYGLPWFDYYDENSKAVKGSKALKNLKSVQKMSKEKDDPIGNESFKPKTKVKLKPTANPNQVREGDF